MFLAESLAKGHQHSGRMRRAGCPNLLLGPFGIVALDLARPARRGATPLRLAPAATPPAGLRPSSRPSGHQRDRLELAGAAAPGCAGRGVVLVVRVPRLHAPMPSLIDRYISRLYVRVAGLSFLALLGPLLHLDVHRPVRQDLQGPGDDGDDRPAPACYMTPQFIYYVIPIAALLSVLVTYGLLARSSELTVMKACGISLYRTALSVVVLSLGFSAVLFSLEQRLMASANRQAEALDAQIRGRQPRTLNLLNRRWVVGPDRVDLPLRQLRPASGTRCSA